MAEPSVYHNIAAIKEESVYVSDDSESELADVERQVIATDDNCPDALEEVWLTDAATVKQEMDIGLTVLVPPDIHFMLRQSKHEPTDTATQANCMPHLRRRNLEDEQYDIRSERSPEKTAGNKQARAQRTHGREHCIEQVPTSFVPAGVATVQQAPSGFGDSGGSAKKSQRRLCTCPNCYRDGGRLHNESKQHRCHVAGCDKQYTKTSHLRAHLYLHAGVRPYACNWLSCERRFTRSDEMQRHWRSHAGVRRFKCGACGKRFLRSDHLAKHTEMHSKKPVAVGRSSSSDKPVFVGIYS